MGYKYRDRYGVLRDERADWYYQNLLYEQEQARRARQAREEKRTRADALKKSAARQYKDLPEPIAAHLTSIDQMKNSMAAITAGIIGQRLNGGNSHIDLRIKKRPYPDAQVTGDTTPESIDTNIKPKHKVSTSVHFKGHRNPDGLLAGEVEKPGPKWDIKQQPGGKYKITGPNKWDDTLSIAVKDGKISGTFARGGPHLDVGIRGTYDKAGNVKFEIAYPLWGMNTTLEGKITRKQNT